MLGMRLTRDRATRHEPARYQLRIERLEDRQMLSADAAAAAVNAFGLDVYEHLQHEEGNLLFSPLSLSTALSMTSLGAAGQTPTEMQEVLHLGADPAIHDSYRDLLTSLLARTITVDDYELLVSNAIWPADGLPVKQDFLQAIQSDYFGHVQNVDYGNPQQAEDLINAWIAGRTDGKIDDLVKDLSPDTLMVLTNAVLFESLWERPFDPRYTRNAAFYREADDLVDSQMMFGNPDVLRTQIDGFDVVEMPFIGEEASMVLLMPLEQNGANELTRELLVGVENWLESADELLGVDLWRERIEMRLPRFETTIETKFNQLLDDLGMPTAFVPGGADFSEMFDGAAGAHIKQVAHKATIEVTEQGTKAAAATVVEIAICFAAGTPVLTPEGSKRIEELRAGDLVLSRDEHNLEAPVEAKRIEETRQGDSPILELNLNGREVRVTDLHPFFVIGRGWTPAGELKLGDRLMTDGERPAVVEGVVETQRSVPVFNLRVADHHTYFVGEKDWGFAVWTHNFYGTGFYADQPFHFMIRDNVTSAIAFMGRIDDPTQLTNTVTPSIEVTPASQGDFDTDGDVDADDYAVWRAAYGQTGVDLPADANGDGVVNTADYTVWRDNRGAIEGTPASRGDFDTDGDVDGDDYTVWRAAYGQTGPDLAADANGDGVVNTADYTVWRDNEGTVLVPSRASGSANAEDQEPPQPLTGPAPALLTSQPVSESLTLSRPVVDRALESDLLLLTLDTQLVQAATEPTDESEDSQSKRPETIDTGFAEFGNLIAERKLAFR